MRVDSRSIVRGIKEERFVRIPRAISSHEYFIDRSGVVVSLSGDAPHPVECKVGWYGQMWVTLHTGERYQKFCVGELVGLTFMADSRPDDGEEYTIAYRDGNPCNTTVDNLRWITALEAAELREPIAEDDDEPELIPIPIDEGPQTLDESLFANLPEPAGPDTAVNELIERIQSLSRRLKSVSKDHSTLLEAVGPFARFHLAAEHRHGHPDTVVLEANRGGHGHSTLTAGDFLKLQSAVREGHPNTAETAANRGGNGHRALTGGSFLTPKDQDRDADQHGQD